MNKESKIVILIVVGVIMALFAIFGPFLIKSYKYQKQVESACEERGLKKCFVGIISCFDTCKSLNLNYLRYDNTGFGSSECWCNNDEKQSIQVY